MVEAVDLPVLVNGDILTVEDAERAMAQSGAHGVMVGRGLLRDPWLLRRIADRASGRAPYAPSLDERRRALLRYFDLIVHQYGDAKPALGKLKKVTGFFTRGVAHASWLREKIYRAGDAETAYDAVHRYFAALEHHALEHVFDEVVTDACDRYKATDSRRIDRRGRVVDDRIRL